MINYAITPIAGEQFTFEMPITVSQFARCKGMTGLNDLTDEFWGENYQRDYDPKDDKPFLLLENMNYLPLRVEGDHIILQVNGDVRGDIFLPH